MEKLDGIDESTVMLGLLTHFLAECPSRPLTTAGDVANNGAVCMPYYSFNDEGIEQSTLKKESFNTRDFGEALQCINSNCHSSTKAACAGDT